MHIFLDYIKLFFMLWTFQHPQVSIGRQEFQDIVYFCGGAIVDTRHVVTAANCVSSWVYGTEFRNPIFVYLLLNKCIYKHFFRL